MKFLVLLSLLALSACYVAPAPGYYGHPHYYHHWGY
jgi:hypothetical protein